MRSTRVATHSGRSSLRRQTRVEKRPLDCCLGLFLGTSRQLLRLLRKLSSSVFAGLGAYRRGMCREHPLTAKLSRLKKWSAALRMKSEPESWSKIAAIRSSPLRQCIHCLRRLNSMPRLLPPLESAPAVIAVAVAAAASATLTAATIPTVGLAVALATILTAGQAGALATTPTAAHRGLPVREGVSRERNCTALALQMMQQYQKSAL
jgi:hypothetical protein